uniref:Uncharacterized protein n=1 Tax=Globodera rostochiensis TaxID=31243 RepID=A0A914HB11_GLORO
MNSSEVISKKGKSLLTREGFDDQFEADSKVEDNMQICSNSPINLCPCVSPSRAIPHLCCGSTLAESVAETAMGELEMTHTAGAGGAATDRLDGPA